VAETVIAQNDPTAVVVYSERAFTQAIYSTIAFKLAAAGLNARDQTGFVQFMSETLKGPGDTIKYDLIPNALGPGVLGDAPVAGSELSLAPQQDTLYINQQRNAILLKGRMSQQRIPISLRDSAVVSNANWGKEILDYGLLNQLGGNTNQGNLAYTGNNATVIPDANHWLLASGATPTTGNEAALSVANGLFSLSLIPQAVAMAQGSLQFPIKPVVIKGVEIAGVLFLNHLQVRDLKKNFNPGEWGNIFALAMQGGQVSGNPLFTGAIGVYENVVMHQSRRIPWGSNAQNQWMVSPSLQLVAGPGALGVTSVARAVFVGAQAATMAFGGAPADVGAPLRASWYEEILDAGNQLRITIGFIWGTKKTQFLSQDYGQLTVSSYASPTGA
jgi:N4-gp56 family major capsid protein